MMYAYDHTDYLIFLKNLASFTGGSFDGVTFYFPSYLGEGYIRLLTLADNQQAIISNYVLKEDFAFYRMPSKPDIFNFRVDIVEHCTGINIEVGKTEYGVNTEIYANSIALSSRYNSKVKLLKNCSVKGIGILLKKEWLDKYFPLNNVAYWSEYIHVLQSKKLNLIPVDFKTRQSLFALIDADFTKDAYQFYAQVRIAELLDAYFKQLVFQKTHFKNAPLAISDINKIIALDIFFTDGIIKLGHVPHINEMAAHANMSASKLKSLFKKIYNQSIGDYFNSCRLYLASKMILKNENTLKGVSYVLGYSSVQHFSTAFKKQFGCTPSAFINNKNL